MAKQTVLNGKAHPLAASQQNQSLRLDELSSDEVDGFDDLDNFNTDDWGDGFSEKVSVSIPDDLDEVDTQNLNREVDDTSIEAVLDDLFEATAPDTAETVAAPARAAASKATSGATLEGMLARALNAEDSEEYFELFADAIATTFQKAEPSQRRWVQRLLSHPSPQTADLLKQAIALFGKTQDDALLPIMAGLVARVAIAPTLQKIQKALNSSLQKRLLEGAYKLVQTARQYDQEEQLLKLVTCLGQSASRRRVMPGRIPELMQRSAQRLSTPTEPISSNAAENINASTVNGSEQSLMVASQQVAPKSAFSILTVGPDGEPTQLKITGPAEIIIRIPKAE